MGAAQSKINNEIMNETINKTMNETTTKLVNKTTAKQETINKIKQSITLVAPIDLLKEMTQEAAELARIICKDVPTKEKGKCVDAIMASMVPKTCGGGLKITQEGKTEDEASIKLKLVDSVELEQKMTEALKAKYDAQQTATADAKAPIVGNANSTVDNKVSSKVVNETINKISLEMRNEVETFQKKNNDTTQDMIIEMYPGMSVGSCDFSQNAAITSISNIGAAKAMKIIGKVTADKITETESTTKQKGTAKSSGGGGLLELLVPLIIGVVVLAVGYKVLTSKSNNKASSAPGAPSFFPTAPSNKYKVGEVITLANGQKALIQGFGKWKKIILV